MKNCSLSFLLITLTWAALLPAATPASATPITYNWVSYREDQNGYDLSGSIVTDGTLGRLSPANVLSWSITVSQGGAAVMQFSSATPNASVGADPGPFGLTASATQLVIPNGTEIGFAVPGRQELEWVRIPNHYGYSAFDSSSIFWVNVSPSMGGTDPWVIAKVACQIDVPPLYQAGHGVPWARDPYANSPTETIGSKGCAMTCLCMAMNKAGVTHFFGGPFGVGAVVENDPGNLNQLLSSLGGYSGLSVDWDAATRIAALFAGVGGLKFNDQWISSYYDPDGAFDYLEKTVCQMNHPVIVAVNHGFQLGTLPNGTPIRVETWGHFVLVTGKEGIKFKINDPYFDKQFLDDYRNIFETRGYVGDPPGDISSLNISASATVPGVDLLVTDPQGRITGVSSENGQRFDGIPASSLFSEALEDDETGAPPTETTQLFHAFQPASGNYSIQVRGYQPSIYTLIVRNFSADGSQQEPIQQVGISGFGSTSQFEVTVGSDSGFQPQVTRRASFGSTAQDIQNAAALGLIDNQGITQSLTAKVEAAQSAASRGQFDAARNILSAFESEISAQSGKHISVVVSEILLQDTAAVASGLTE